MTDRDFTEKDVENLIKNSSFPDPAHKDALRERLFSGDLQLGLGDLEQVAGGTAPSAPEEWTPWTASEDDTR